MASREKVDRLLGILKAREKLGDVLHQFQPIIEKMLSAIEPYNEGPMITSKEMIEFSKKAMAPYVDNFFEKQAVIYAETYTDEEVDALIELNSSPIGQSILGKSSDLATKLGEITAEFVGKSLENVSRILDKQQKKPTMGLA